MAGKGLILAILLGGFRAVAAPDLTGPYKGELGVVQFETQGGRVSGHYAKGGECNFEPDRRIVEGAFEGNVLVGTVTLCQVGQSCQERVYPLLAFFNPHDGMLSADVKLEPGCQSPALSGKRLLLQKGAPADAAGGKRGNAKRSQELSLKAFDLAQRAVHASDFQRAKREFEIALSYDEKNYVGYLGLGVAEISLSHVQAAIEAYRRAAELKPDYVDAYYNLACAYARLGDRKETLANLNKAVQLGFAEPDTMVGDRDLGSLLGSDPEFNQLLAKLRDQQKHHKLPKR